MLSEGRRAENNSRFPLATYMDVLLRYHCYPIKLGASVFRPVQTNALTCCRISVPYMLRTWEFPKSGSTYTSPRIIKFSSQKPSRQGPHGRVGVRGGQFQQAVIVGTSICWQTRPFDSTTAEGLPKQVGLNQKVGPRAPM